MTLSSFGDCTGCIWNTYPAKKKAPCDNCVSYDKWEGPNTGKGGAGVLVRSCYGLVRDDVHGTRLSIGDDRRYVAVPLSLSERRDAIGNGKFYYLGNRYWGLIAKNKDVFKIWMKGAPLKVKVIWAMRLSKLYFSMWWSDHSFRRYFRVCYICIPPGHSMTGRPYEYLYPNVNGGLTFSDGDRVFGWDYGHSRNRLDYEGDLKRAYRYFKRYEKEGDGR